MPAERGRRIAGIVLAAGTSSRMGRNKLLLQFDGESLLRGSVRRAIAAGLDPVIVVLGHEGDRTRQELDGLSCTAVVNPDYNGGVHLSLRTGIAALPETAEATVVMLADMPFVTTNMLATLVRRHRDSAAPLVVSQYGEIQAPPTLYARPLFAELASAEGPGCGKAVVRRHRDEASVLSWPAERLDDVDVPDDYDRAKSRIPVG
ncbi:MAG TPA: nucleotidyltransferase family protein [Gemmatimonadales bacterium]